MRKSPSKSDRIHGCSGSLAYIKDLKDRSVPLWRGPVEAAAKGAAVHKLMDVCLTQAANLSDYKGKYIYVYGYQRVILDRKKNATLPNEFIFEIDDEMIESITPLIEYVMASVAELSVEIQSNPLPDRDDTGGMLDIELDSDDTLEIIDFKNGRFDVEIKNNKQLLCYLLGRAEYHLWSHDKYKMTVFQRGQFKSADVSKDYLKIFSEVHRNACEKADEALNHVNDENFSLNWLSCGDHCAMCPAKVICPEYKKSIEFDVNIDVDTLELEEMKKVVVNAAKYRSYLNACEEVVHEYIGRAKIKDERFVLGHGRGRRELRDDIPEEKIVEYLVKCGYFEKSQIKDLYKLISGPQIEKRIPKEKRASFNDDFLVKNYGKDKLYVKTK